MDIPISSSLTLFPSLLMPLSKPASTFAQHIHDSHAEIRSAIAMSNNSYKLSANVHGRDTYFEVGDFVMTRVQPESLPKHF